MVSIAGTEEQVDAAKKEIQRLIGTFAGVGEYDESKAAAPQWSVLSSMHSLFSGSLDLQQLEKYMQGQMANPSFFQAPAQPAAPDAAPTMPTMPAMPAMPAMPGMTNMTNMTTMPMGGGMAKEAPVETAPGMDDEAPPGLYECLLKKQSRVTRARSHCGPPASPHSPWAKPSCS